MNVEELFWDLAEGHYGDPAVTRSTMMGLPCLRYDGRFFASLDRGTRALVVKLPRPRVQQVIRQGHGRPFAPAGKVFREWVAIARPDRRRWHGLLAEAKALAAGGASPPHPALPTAVFAGFGEDGLAFLAALECDNTKAYFDAHRDLYQRALLKPAKAFVVALGHLLAERLLAGLRAEPRIGGSMFRITNDLRFNAGRAPYKTHLDFVFWDGDRGPRRDPALILRLTPTQVLLGAGVPALDGPALRRYRAALTDLDQVADLDSAVAALLASDAQLSAPSRIRVPAGIDPAGPAARYAVGDGLYVTRSFPRPKAATTPAFPDWCVRRLEPFVPVQRWLVRKLRDA